MNRDCTCLIGLRSVDIFLIGWEMKMRKRSWFSAKNDHFWHFWFSNFFITVIEELYIKIHLHAIKNFFGGVYWDARNCQKRPFLTKLFKPVRSFIFQPISKISTDQRPMRHALPLFTTREKLSKFDFKKLKSFELP